MISIKTKVAKKKPKKGGDITDTIENVHNTKLKQIEENNELIKEMNETIKTLKEELIYISQNDRVKRNNIIETIAELTKKIKEMQKFEIDYHMNSMHVLREYYNPLSDSSYSDYSSEEEPQEQDDDGKVTVQSFIDKVNDNNTYLYKKYLHSIGEDINDPDQYNDITSHLECINCKGVYLEDEQANNLRFCRKCGYSEQVLENTLRNIDYTHLDQLNLISGADAPSSSNNMLEKQSTTITKLDYKHIVHLNNWFKQLQGKDNSNIPDEIYECLKKELAKLRIDPKRNPKKVTKKIVKQILKDNNYNLYYKFIPSIIATIKGTNKCNIEFSQDVIEKIRAMLLKTLEPYFEKFKPKDRSNYYNFSFFIIKCLEILHEWGDITSKQLRVYKENIPQLTCRDKLKIQNDSWIKLVKYLGWPAISSC